jgi:hypothetical protein
MKQLTQQRAAGVIRYAERNSVEAVVVVVAAAVLRSL